MEQNQYDIEEHAHRFGIWTAARAQRGTFSSSSIIRKVFEKIKLRENVAALAQHTTATDFDSWHTARVNELVEVLSAYKPAKFGRGAKILNVYLKTVFVLLYQDRSHPVMDHIHPPIDSILLKGLIKEGILTPDCRQPWTLMEEPAYKEIIRQLRENGITPLWKAECFWNPDGELQEEEP